MRHLRQPVMQPTTSLTRRAMLKRAGLGAAAALAATVPGCVPASGHGQTELVWGRRGQSSGRFLKPRAITIDRNDQLYIVDTTGRIQVFDRDGNWLRQWKTPETKNGRPTGLAIQHGRRPEDDLLLVADTHYYRMLVYHLDGRRIESKEIGGQPGRDPGQFAFVTDAVSDDDGCFYIGEYGDSDRIQKFDPDGNFMTQWGGTGRETEKFVRPQSLVIAGDVLWIADACNHRIQRYDISGPTPRWIDAWGQQGQQPGQFHYPYDLALLADGGVLVCEYGNQRIQRLAADGTPQSIWGAPGFEVGQLYQPWGLVVDSENRMHVLDSNNHRIQRTRLPA
ncbi:NHL repeat protein [Stieleria magnilauensis]|uniref:NHL repeat protein n=2 Tax=Stieleria magnilauensis TaxID=2527963 RepID=A0ABX5XZN7_9BACT|nr:NHL repeat protein [Planctomycetes bacterium TBK1r]